NCDFKSSSLAEVARIRDLLKCCPDKQFFGRGVSSKVVRLEITFHTAKLREICEKRDTAASELGYAVARELAERLADVEVIDTVDELCALLGRLISDRSPTEKAIHLSPGFDVVFVSGHPSPREG